MAEPMKHTPSSVVLLATAMLAAHKTGLREARVPVAGRFRRVPRDSRPTALLDVRVPWEPSP
jgi:hypothetical protein